MAVKLKVNKDVCIGCGACVGAFPEAFTFDAEGKAECVKEVEKPEEVKANCPVGAIEG